MMTGELLQYAYVWTWGLGPSQTNTPFSSLIEELHKNTPEENPVCISLCPLTCGTETKALTFLIAFS